MSQPTGEKTEKPTPKKLRDARKKGQIAQSREIPSAAVITGALLIIWIGWDFYLNRFKELILLPVQYFHLPFNEGLYFVLTGVFKQGVILVLPILVASIILAVLANLLQFGLLFSIEPVKPDLNKINPAEGFKRIFALHNLIELIKSIVKVLFLSIMIYLVIKTAMAVLIKIPFWGIAGIFNVLSNVIGKIVVFSIIAFIVVACLDHFFQQFLHIRKNKMTKDEVRRERKEMYGDPIIKSKRRRMHKEFAMNAMLANMRKASVLVTNPTHLAIALYYDEDETGLPIVLAKGQDYIAEQMIKIAEEENIPIMQDVPLAHDLYNNVDIDSYIPHDLIKPVAEVIKWVWGLNKGDV